MRNWIESSLNISYLFFITVVFATYILGWDKVFQFSFNDFWLHATVLFQALPGQVWIKYESLWFWKLIILNCGFFSRVTWAFLLQENILVEWSEFNTVESRKATISPYYWSDKDFKCTVVNRALPYLYGRSLEITLTVPLKGVFA